jgi:hypothetical protein
MPFKDKQARRTYQLKWQRENKELCAGYNKKFSEAHPDKVKGYRLKINHGVTFEWYERKYHQQKGKCAICDKRFPLMAGVNGLCVDHDHHKNIIRGLLCVTCNAMLGFYEQESWRNNADKYLSGYN